MRVIAINAPWVKERINNIGKWYGLEFVFDVIDITLPSVPMQAHPTMQGLAVLDMEFVNKYKQGFTMFVAPYQLAPLPNRASVAGIFLPPLLSLYRWEWFLTRLFWNSPVIEVFANENDHVYVKGKDLGLAFEMWSYHEFSHWLYQTVQKPDKTHDYFYSGEPEKARDEICSVFKPPPLHVPVEKSNREKFYDVAIAALGTDISPKDVASDTLACVESWCSLYEKAFEPFHTPPIYNTTDLKQILLYRKDFVRLSTNETPLRGDTILSAGRGGTRKNPDGTPVIAHGHVGILGDDEKIMSNSSATGKWIYYYTLDSWADRWVRKGGYQIEYWRKI